MGWEMSPQEEVLLWVTGRARRRGHWDSHCRGNDSSLYQSPLGSDRQGLCSVPGDWIPLRACPPHLLCTCCGRGASGGGLWLSWSLQHLVGEAPWPGQVRASVLWEVWGCGEEEVLPSLARGAYLPKVKSLCLMGALRFKPMSLISLSL